MNTPSHFLLHLWLRKYYEERKNVQIPKSFLLWSVGPDIWLYLCVFGYMLYSQVYVWNSSEYTFRHMFDVLYFEHPFWIFAYNIFHAPLMLGVFFAFIKLFQNYLGKYYSILLWFILGCMLHSLFDIPLHHDDGPRIFYPLSDYQFSSPISYWDRDYHAVYIIFLEICMSLSMIFYVFAFPKIQKYLWKS